MTLTDFFKSEDFWKYTAIGAVSSYLSLKIFRKVAILGPVVRGHHDLSGKIVVVTGSSSGIGYATADILAGMGATIIFACRNEKKTKKAMTEIEEKTKNNNLHFIQLDLSDFESIEKFHKEFTSKFDKLDILVNNAAGFSKLEDKLTTKQGFELMFGVNHLGHHFLTKLLIPSLAKTKGRIVYVGSEAHHFIKETEKDFDFHKFTNFPIEGRSSSLTGLFEQYCSVKICNIFHTNILHKLYFEKYGITSVAMCPGFVELTNDLDPLGWGKLMLLKWPINWIFGKDLHNGAQCVIHCSIKPVKSGKFYLNNKEIEPTDLAKSKKISQELWDWSESQCCNFSEYYKNFNK